MSDKIIIELELLTPMKYESVLISVKEFGASYLKITEIYKNNHNSIKNTKTESLSQVPSKLVDDYVRVNNFEKCILIGSMEVRDFIALNKSIKQHKGLVVPRGYQSDIEPEFKGLHKLEENNKYYCLLHYIVKNPTPEVSSFLSSFSMRKDTEYFIDRSDLDPTTADIFGDMYGEL
jgi:hypothetical protein